MPMNYHISPDEGLITVNVTGDVRAGELARLGRSLLDEDAYDPDLPQLLDLRGLRPVPAGELETLRRFVHDTYRPQVAGSVAVVIDEHLERSHSADIYLLTCAIGQAELFADYDQALKWLMRRAFAAPAPSAQQDDAGGDDPHRAPE